MALLKVAVNEQAYLKAGILGFPGSGKTFTAMMLAIAIAKQLEKDKPIAFFDTETGSDFLLQQVQAEGLQMLRVKSAAFQDLLQVVKEATGQCSVLIVDSVTHVWRDLCEGYRKKRNRTRLEFQDWAVLKQEWGKYTVAYLNSPLHIIVCGRAGYEYDFETNEDGKKELIKAGTKMKVESEFGFEPSLLIEMERAERSSKPGSGWTHRAHVLKDRTDTINGKAFDFHKLEGGYKPGGYAAVLDAFAPVIKCLNLGGDHLGIDTTRTSEDLISGDPPDFSWKREQQAKEVALDEIQEEIKRAYPTKSNEDTKQRADLLEELAGTRSWKAVEAMKFGEVIEFRSKLWKKLRGHDYGMPPPGTLSDPPDTDSEEDPDWLASNSKPAGGGEAPSQDANRPPAGGSAPENSGDGAVDFGSRINPSEVTGDIQRTKSDFDRIKERARQEKAASRGFKD